MKTSTKIALLTLNDTQLDKKVKIQGTKYDRKRKVTDDILSKMKKLHRKMSYTQIAKELDLNYQLVRYNLDPIYRSRTLSSCSGVHTGKTHMSKSNRVAYKRQLIAQDKVTA